MLYFTSIYVLKDLIKIEYLKYEYTKNTIFPHILHGFNVERLSILSY